MSDVNERPLSLLTYTKSLPLPASTVSEPLAVVIAIISIPAPAEILRSPVPDHSRRSEITSLKSVPKMLNALLEVYPNEVKLGIVKFDPWLLPKLNKFTVPGTLPNSALEIVLL